MCRVKFTLGLERRQQSLSRHLRFGLVRAMLTGHGRHHRFQPALLGRAAAIPKLCPHTFRRRVETAVMADFVQVHISQKG